MFNLVYWEKFYLKRFQINSKNVLNLLKIYRIKYITINKIKW